MARDKVKIRVGETLFFISRGTIASGGRQTLLASMTDSLWESPDALANSCSEADELFIDRDPTYFRVLLDLLRTGELRIPAGMSETALFQEALYYGLLDQVRAAKWGPLDGDTMVRAQLVPGYGRASHVDLKFRGSMPMIMSNADSGCCVSCDAVVRTYDWTLQQQAVISLKYAHACDVAYMGTSRVLVGTIDCDDASDPTGMACFDASSGAMLHQYQLTDGGRSWSFNGNNITTSEGEHVFAACRYNDDEDCVVIGTWDQTTGQQVQLLDLTMFGITSRCNMYKLQWLPSRNLLMVTTVDVNEGASISLFDMRSRQRSMMWPQDGSIMMSQETLMDVVAMEDSSTIWAADDSDRLGLLDIRGGLAGGADWIWWCDRGDVFAVSPSAPRGSGPYVRQPKLAYWGSRLFASREDSIHVVGNTNWAGPDCAVTATVQRAPGGEISDMSIGGDRLFVAHKGTAGFEVWETPGKRGGTFIAGGI